LICYIRPLSPFHYAAIYATLDAALRHAVISMIIIFDTLIFAVAATLFSPIDAVMPCHAITDAATAILPLFDCYAAC